MRIFSIIIIVAIVAISFGVAYRNSSVAHRAKDELDNERYSRMVAEENYENAIGKIKTLESKLARKDNKLAALEKLSEELKAMNEDLRARLDKAAELKEVMEGKIQELQSLSSSL